MRKIDQEKLEALTVRDPNEIREQCPICVLNCLRLKLTEDREIIETCISRFRAQGIATEVVMDEHDAAMLYRSITPAEIREIVSGQWEIVGDGFNVRLDR